MYVLQSYRYHILHPTALVTIETPVYIIGLRMNKILLIMRKSDHGAETEHSYTNSTNFKRRIKAQTLASICFMAFLFMSEVQVLAFGVSHKFIKRSQLLPRHLELRATPDDKKETSGFGHIPEETIEEIKTYADIVTVIESYDLPFFSRSSDGYRAKSICPFHNDKNPSLNIDNSRGIYKCFSCGAGGDVFNFVREYDFISSNQKGAKMSYPAAIQKVAGEFCGGALAQKVQSTLSSGSYNRTMTPEKRERLDKQRKLKERMLLANSAAADFYAKGLITNPTAGIARSHLHQRGITPAIVRTFALGFAPEAYFNSGKASTWGKGSLVERLEELKFSPQEILDAGLATLTSKARSRLQLSSTGKSIMLESAAKKDKDKNDANKSEKAEKSELEYSDLMDRFRSRLMVPIFDPSGRHVIGFGGRHLEIPKSNNGDESNERSTQSYVAAKYLNTPETPAFSKKNVLFGLHSASIAVDDSTKNNKSIKNSDPALGLTFQSNVPTIVIVEGYFDAISLYGSGIHEAVASMGTALTIEQLKMSAATLGNRGRIILCLDNDEAGINAVERLCASSGIWEFLEGSGVEIKVASLPPGIKDPAEFIEAKGGVSKTSSGEEFRTEILGNTQPWNLWFISRLISRYDPTDSSSFSSVCENISNFLSTHSNAADRTKQAYEAAGKLATYIAKDSGGSGEGPLRIQLESDLLGMASRKASARDALARRIEAADGKRASKDTIARMYSGEATVVRDQPEPNLVGDKTTKKSNGELKQSQSSRQFQSRRKIQPRTFDDSYRSRHRRSMQFGKVEQAPPITKHFNGFAFKETDAAWLGITNERERKKFVLGEPEKRNNRVDPVYFNSNEYLGNERSFLSTIGDMNSTVSAVEGIKNKMVKPDGNIILLEAENRLLYTMVHHPSARLAMKSALGNRMGGGKTLEWSSLDREWLFHCLTDSPGYEHLPVELQDGGTSLQLKEHLMNHPHVPDGAFDPIAKDISEDSKDRTDIESGTQFIDANLSSISSKIAGDDTKIRKGVVDEEEGMRFEMQGSEQDLLDNKTELIADNPSEPIHSENAQHPKLQGTLDQFFVEDEELVNLEIRDGSASHEERSELVVQESVAIMLKATAINNLNRLKSEWETTITVQKSREKLMSNASLPDDGIVKNSRDMSLYESLNDDQLGQLFESLGQKVIEAMTTARELTESSNELNKRLLNYCAAGGVEGRINIKQREELAKALDEHLASLPEDPRPNESGASTDYIFGSDEFDNSIDPRFGGGRPNSLKAQPPSGRDKKTPIQEEVYDSIFE